MPTRSSGRVGSNGQTTGDQFVQVDPATFGRKNHQTRINSVLSIPNMIKYRQVNNSVGCIFNYFHRCKMKVYWYKGHKIVKTAFFLPTIRQCFDNFYRTTAPSYVVKGPKYNIWSPIFGCRSLEQAKEEINFAIQGGLV